MQAFEEKQWVNHEMNLLTNPHESRNELEGKAEREEGNGRKKFRLKLIKLRSSAI